MRAPLIGGRRCRDPDGDRGGDVKKLEDGYIMYVYVYVRYVRVFTVRTVRTCTCLVRRSTQPPLPTGQASYDLHEQYGVAGLGQLDERLLGVEDALGRRMRNPKV